MALQMNFPTKSGAIITNAYVDIQALKAKKLFGGIQLIITAWNSSTDKGNGKSPLDAIYKVTIPESDSIYSTYFDETVVDAAGNTDTKQAYIYIKTLDGTQTEGVASTLAGIDFTSATDV